MAAMFPQAGATSPSREVAFRKTSLANYEFWRNEFSLISAEETLGAKTAYGGNTT
jgi:hypothetical protein